MGVSIAHESASTNGPSTTYQVTIDGLTLYTMADLGHGSVEAALAEAIRLYLAQRGQNAQIASHSEDTERQLRNRMNA